MTEQLTPGRYPGYDVLRKRESQSWNDKTREVIDARLRIEARPLFLAANEWRTLVAVCDRVMPQPAGRPRVPLEAYVEQRLSAGKSKGYRLEGIPQPAEAWKRALAALEQVAMQEQGRPFANLTHGDQDAILRRMAEGLLQASALRGMPARSFWTSHVIHDVIGAYYAHPRPGTRSAWRGRPRRGAMYGWIWTGAIPGSRQKPPHGR